MYSVYERLCRQRGVDSAEVSKCTGIAQTTISNWKKRNNLIGGKTAIAIAEYFGVSLNYLMTGHEFIGSNSKTYNINDFEYMIICEYRALPIHKQEAILDILHIEMDVERKNPKEA